MHEADENGEWCIDQVTNTGLCVTLYNDLPKGMRHVIMNGCNGVWALVPVNEKESNLMFMESCCNDEKVITDANHVDGKVILKGIPSGARLFMDCSGGVWMYIAANESSSAAFLVPHSLSHIAAPGSDRPYECMASDLDKKCLLCSDSARKGMLVLIPGKKAGQSVLSHIDSFW